MPRDVHIELAASTADALEDLLAPCVSEAAVFIETQEPEPVGDRIRLQLSLSTGEPALRLLGTVAWVFPKGAAPVGRPAGMGILVEAGDDDSLERLDRIQQRGSSSPLARIPGASFWRFSLPDGAADRFGSLDKWRREGAIAPQQEWRETSMSHTVPMAVIDSVPSDDGDLDGATARLETALSSDGSDVASETFFDRAKQGDVLRFANVSGAASIEGAAPPPPPDGNLPARERIHDEPTQISAPLRPAGGPSVLGDDPQAGVNVRSHRNSRAEESPAVDDSSKTLVASLDGAPPTAFDGPRHIADDITSSATETLVTPAPDLALSPGQGGLSSMDDNDVFAAAAEEDGEDTDRTASQNHLRGFDADEGDAAMTLPRRPLHAQLVSNSEGPAIAAIAAPGLTNRGTPLQDVPAPPPLAEAGFDPSDEGGMPSPPVLFDRAPLQPEDPEPVIHRMPTPASASQRPVPQRPVAQAPATAGPSATTPPSRTPPPLKDRNRTVPRPKVSPRPTVEGPSLADEISAPTPPAPPIRPAPAMGVTASDAANPFSDAALIDDEDVFFDASDSTAEVESIKNLVTLDDEEELPDLPTQTNLRVRPVIRRLFKNGQLPRPKRWPRVDVEPPAIHGAAARFSRIRDVEEKGVQTMLEAVTWPSKGTARTSIFDTRVDEEIDEAEKRRASQAHSGHLGGNIRIGGTGSFAEDDALGLDVTDPSTLTQKVEDALELPSVDDDSDPGDGRSLSERPAPAPSNENAKARAQRALPKKPISKAHFVPTALFVRVDGSQAVLFDVGTKVPARVARVLPSTGAPVTIELLEGEQVIGDLLWSGGDGEAYADLSCEVEANGIIFVLIQDAGGQSLTARLQTSWATGDEE